MTRQERKVLIKMRTELMDAMKMLIETWPLPVAALDKVTSQVGALTELLASN